jgi:Flp pilus assembly protein TadG
MGNVSGCDSGATAVEFAIVAPVFLLFLVGTLSVSLLMFTASSLHYAVEEAARCASVKTSVCTDATATRDYARSHYYGISATPTFTYTPPSSAACGGNQVSGAVTYVLETYYDQWSIPLTATACFP